MSEPILLDGVLDEPAWQSSPRIGSLVQRIPTEGAVPSERTEVTLLRDADHLYIGVMCHDSEPGRVLASQMARDASLRPDDYVQLLLDTFRDQSNAYYFSTNPNGALVDGLVFANGETNEDWGAIWNVATQRSDRGWSAEFAIPFKSLNFPPDGTVWGFNISRNIQRKFEEARWAGARFDAQFFQVSEAGEISGLGGLEQGRGLDIRPFVAGRWDYSAGSGDDSLRGKPGLDLFYNVTPNPEADGHVQHGFRRNGSRRAPDQPDPLLDLLSREAVLLPAGRRRLQLRHHRGRPAGGHSQHGSGGLPVLQPPHRLAARPGGSARLRAEADRQGGPDRGRRAQRRHARHLVRP